MRLGQQLFCTGTVLHVGSMHLQDEEVAFGINREMVLASFDLFAAVKAALTASLSRLDGLAIDDAAVGSGLRPCCSRTFRRAEGGP